MFKLFLLLIFLYFLFKAVKYVFRAFFNGVQSPPKVNNTQPHYSKYKDVEDAKFVEIKEDKPQEKDKHGSNGSK